MHSLEPTTSSSQKMANLSNILTKSPHVQKALQSARASLQLIWSI